MKFKSALLTQVSGSIGGLTFAHNQSGMYARGRGLPTNPATELQQIIRNAMSSGHTAWKNLDPEVRAGWQSYSDNTPIVNPLGDQQKIGGLAMFIRQYISRAQAGVTQITTAPSFPGLSALEPVSVARHLADDAFDFTYDDGDDWCVTTGGYLAVFQSRAKSAVNNFFKGPYQYAGKLLGNTAAPPASPFFVASLWPLVAGQRYFFRVIAVDSEGRMTAAQFLQLDIA
jgi:hypothetical protein